MKTSLFATVLFSIPVWLTAQTGGIQSLAPVSDPPQNTPFAIVQRDGNNIVWQRTTYEQMPDGQWQPSIESYQETATGLNFKNPATGEWETSTEEIEIIPGGAVARHGQHKVIFAADIATVGAIDLETPDGQRLQSHLLGLAYLDRASGKSFFIAEITNSIGQLISSNQVWYDNAFTGVKAGVRYTYTREGFEQDVILESQPPPPEAFGLNRATTILQAYTEFLSPPTPAITMNFVSAGSGAELPDKTLSFNTMKIGRGHAFLMGNSAQSVAVAKDWATIEDRQFLIEEVPIVQINAELQNLPAGSGFSGRFSNSVVNVVASKHLSPRTPLVQNSNNQIRMVMAGTKIEGYVLDYSSENTSQTNYTFRGDTTYYISGNLNLVGTNTTFEGGTVLKYAAGVTLKVGTPVTWGGSAYRPVVLMSKDDNSIAEPISGSSGSPGTSYYAAKALYFDGTTALTNLTIDNLRILNAQAGVVINGRANHVLSNVQMTNCAVGIAATNADFSVRNVLLAGVLTNFSGSSATGHVEHLTSDVAIWLNKDIGSNLFLTNCILSAVTNLGSCTTQSVALVSSGAGVFQPTGAGGYYLTNGSAYRNAGTTNINPALRIQLGKKTTYPPVLVLNSNFTVATTLGPTVQRDSDTPDLGYHYDPLDYVFSGVSISSNLTVSAGTSVGWFKPASGNAYAVHLADRTKIIFNGLVDAQDYFVRTSTAQEGNLGWGAGIAGYGIVGSQNQYSEDITYSSEIDMNFTTMAAMIWEQQFRDYSGFLIVRANNSVLTGGNCGGYLISSYFTNCLMDNNQVGTVYGYPGNEVYLRNCTLHNGRFYGARHTPIRITVKDCAFENVTLDGVFDSYSSNTNYTDYSFNAYTNATDPFPNPTGTSYDKNSVKFNWQVGKYGNFYLPANSTLINAGHTNADSVGLYHFTTQTNQAREAKTMVDIGYHYVAGDCGALDTVWVDDALPAGASPGSDGGDSWTWVSSNPSPFSAQAASQSSLNSGEHQHYFVGATAPLTANSGDSLVAYVYLDPTNTPTEIMLQWNDGAGGWDHRAYWGANNIAWGTDGTVSKYCAGALPAVRQWVRLAVPASLVGLEGHTLVGMALTIYGGRATWDYLGKNGGTYCYDTDADTIPDYLEDVNGNGTFDSGDLSDWRDPDNDHDGLPDGWEIQHFGNLLQTGSGDFDGDGLSNLQEYQLGTDPCAADTDGDGLTDAEELTILIDASNTALGYLNPLQADTGATGIPDGQKDGDHDSISNLGELRKYGSNPSTAHSFNVAKTDPEYLFTAKGGEQNTAATLHIAQPQGGMLPLSISGGLANGPYDLYFINNLNAPRWQWRRVYTGAQCDSSGNCAFKIQQPELNGFFIILSAADSDGDGLSDGYEAWFTYNGQHTMIDDPESDLDLLPDGWEVEYGLNPMLATGNDGRDGNPDSDLDSDTTPLTNLKEYSYSQGLYASYDPLKAFGTSANRSVVLFYADTVQPSCEESSFTIYRFAGDNNNNPLTVYYSVGGSLSYDDGDYTLNPPPPAWPRIYSATIPAGDDHVKVTVNAPGVSPNPGQTESLVVSLTPYAVSPVAPVSDPYSWDYVLSWPNNRFTITYANQNLRPSADGASSQACPNTDQQITLGGRGSCGQSVTFRIVSGPSHGSLDGITLVNSSQALVNYHPNPGFCGEDSFTFKVNDGLRDSAPATISLGVGDPSPKAYGQDVMTGINTPVTFTLSGSDNCNSTLTFAPVPGSGPNPGTLSTINPVDVNHASVTYTPNSTFEGEDGFNFTAGNCRASGSDYQNHVTINVVPGPTLTTECRQDRIVLHWTIPPWIENKPGFVSDFRIYRCSVNSGTCVPVTPYTTITDSNARTYVDNVGTSAPNTTYCYRITFRHINTFDGTITYESPFSNADCNQVCPLPVGGPIDVAFIVDNTGSMGALPLEQLRNGITKVLDDIAIASGNDYELALVTPDEDKVYVRLAFSLNNRDDFITKLNSVLPSNGVDLPESTDECLDTVVEGRAANGRQDPRSCGTQPLQSGNFSPGFRTSPSTVRKFVVMITDAEPGGFCSVSDNGVHAAIYASLARDACIKINAIQVSNDPATSAVMQNYYHTTCGWYEQLTYSGNGIAEAVARMLYVPGYCTCP